MDTEPWHRASHRVRLFLTSCTQRCLPPTPSRTRCSLRGMVLTTSVLLRVFILEEDVTTCHACAVPSWRDKAKRHLSQSIDMSVLHDERCKSISMEKQVDDLQRAFRDSAMRAFGRPRKAPVAPWISKRTWKIVQLEGPIRNIMQSVRKHSNTLFLSVAFFRWLSLFSVAFSPGENTPVVCRDGMHPRALILICNPGPPWCAPKQWHIVRSLMCNAWPDHCLPTTSVFMSRARLGRSRKK